MFQKVLIANRGEIAVRVIRACRQMGIETVAIYSEADRESLHVQIADESICVGRNASSESYLNMENIITAAIATGAEAIHPGFGFLSENEAFARLCEECGIRFIGPSADVISLMGDKSSARKAMLEAGVPVVPGSDGVVKTVLEAKKIASKIGYPVLLKASAGGGGRGMRVAKDEVSLEKAFETAKVEAKNAFGNDEMYIERYVQSPRHVEIQILADRYGNVVHLFERDCTIQRRNQKIIEEAPSLLSSDMRNQLTQAAVKAAKSVGYENAGTVEFLVSNDQFYFIEMNTRIQVEHPVTEWITGIDIVKEQIKIASGERLSFSQENITANGHAIEVRLNAEDPYHNFRPSPGTITALHVPGGFNIRFDSHIYTGYTVPPYYDSMLGKLVAFGNTRKEAIMHMITALDELVISGVTNNRGFCRNILLQESFQKNDYDTSFIAKHLEELLGDESHES
jgi:acetyl-CoA carboxylase biotin carboxylase subunit